MAAGVTQHHPNLVDGIDALKAHIDATHDGQRVTAYQTLHRVLADGNFVLTLTEGLRNRVPSSFFDLFRVTEGRIDEHWSTIEALPDPSTWKNNNGKF